MLRSNGSRWLLGIAALIILAGMYLFQRFDFSMLIGEPSANIRFIVNKSMRFLINDLACLALIVAIFNSSGYLRLGTLLFVLEFLVLLPLYFALKLTMEGDSEISSPLLSQLHRMIINPLLMIVLMLGFLYQNYFLEKKRQ